MVLLGLRSSIKEALSSTSAELVYGSPLRLPGEFVIPTPDHGNAPTPHHYLDELRNFIRRLQPVPPRRPTHPKVFTSQNLTTCTHAFLRKEGIKKGLTPRYNGPYKVLTRTSKTFTLDINGREEVVAADRIKPAFMDSAGPTLPNNVPHLPGRPIKQVSWHL
ncbi:uncharacterized protein ISCGN_016543 [Ixodes scapularis]